MGAAQSGPAPSGQSNTLTVQEKAKQFTRDDVIALTKLVEEMTEKKKPIPQSDMEQFLQVAISIMDNLRMQVETGTAPKKVFGRVISRMTDGKQEKKTFGVEAKLQEAQPPEEAQPSQAGVVEEYRMMPRREYYEPMGFNLR